MAGTHSGAALTNLHRLGVDDKTIQAILRHSNVAVTHACYIKTVSADAIAAMQQFESAIPFSHCSQQSPSKLLNLVDGLKLSD